MNPGKAPISERRKKAENMKTCTHEGPHERVFDNKGNDKCVTPNKPQHTPTPWYVSENTLNDESTKQTIWIDDMSGNAVFVLPKMGGRTYQAQMEDAAFIVRAVNCHEELVQSIKEMREYVEEAYETKGPTLFNILNRAEKAIATAEGGK